MPVSEQQFLRAVRDCVSASRPIVPSRVLKDNLEAAGIQWGYPGRSGGYLEKVERPARKKGKVHAWSGVYQGRRMNGWSLPGPKGKRRQDAVTWAKRNGWSPIP
jgi:hypothetical protein